MNKQQENEAQQIAEKYSSQSIQIAIKILEGEVATSSTKISVASPSP